MARKLRIEYEGAVHHVISRENYRSDVFGREATRAAFLKCLDEACVKSGWRVHAWCVMSNHYHLCVETPSANLVAGMKWLQATFSLRFNRLRSERGHVFQGRYKALPVAPESVGALCHYIHLNPVRAKIRTLANVAEWPWSSLAWLTAPKVSRAEGVKLCTLHSTHDGRLEGVDHGRVGRQTNACSATRQTTRLSQSRVQCAKFDPFPVSLISEAEGGFPHLLGPKDIVALEQTVKLPMVIMTHDGNDYYYPPRR